MDSGNMSSEVVAELWEACYSGPLLDDPSIRGTFIALYSVVLLACILGEETGIYSMYANHFVSTCLILMSTSDP